MADIKPRIVDGEPFATSDCPLWKPGHDARVGECYHAAIVEACVPGGLCIPGLRQQRDEAIKERDEARREICEYGYRTARWPTAKAYADWCGWSYLYPDEEESHG